MMQVSDTAHNKEGNVMEKPSKEQGLAHIKEMIPLSFFSENKIKRSIHDAFVLVSLTICQIINLSLHANNVESGNQTKYTN